VNEHPAPSRWEPCCLCKGIFEPRDLVPASVCMPKRKRGWVCLPCARRRCEAAMVAAFALSREPTPAGDTGAVRAERIAPAPSDIGA
jgi:hypothetical protein